MLFHAIQNALLMWPENIPMLSMLPRAFAEHGKAREAWEAWGSHGLPMNFMLFPMLPIPGLYELGCFNLTSLRTVSI